MTTWLFLLRSRHLSRAFGQRRWVPALEAGCTASCICGRTGELHFLLRFKTPRLETIAWDGDDGGAGC